MVRLRGLLSISAAFVAITALMGAQETKAATYFLNVTITDNTTNTTTNYTLGENSPGNVYQNPAGSVNPEQITPNASSGLANTASTGVILTGLGTSTTYGALSTILTVGGTAQVVAGSTDSYTVTISATYTGYTLPPGTVGTLAQSESGTYAHTTGGTDNQQFTSTYVSGSNTFSPGTQTISIPNTGTVPTSLGSNTPGSVALNPYSPNYNLTATIVLNLKGNTVTPGANATATFGGQATVTAVPEPASLVMMLTGMPLPLVVLGVLRRRRANG